MHTHATSPIHALLALPEIGSQGIERSVIFPQLPAATQAAIRAVANETGKRQLAAQAGDALPVILEMYEHHITQPQQRRRAGLAFPTLADLGNFRPAHARPLMAAHRSANHSHRAHPGVLACPLLADPRSLRRRRAALGCRQRR